MEIIEQLIPDLVNIVTGYLGNGIFPGDFNLPLDSCEYEEENDWKYHDEKSEFHFEIGNSSPFIQLDLKELCVNVVSEIGIVRCDYCSIPLIGPEKYVTLDNKFQFGFFIQFSYFIEMACSECAKSNSYIKISYNINITTAALMKFKFNTKNIICSIKNKSFFWLFLDVNGKILILREKTGNFFNYEILEDSLTYSDLIKYINNIIKSS